MQVSPLRCASVEMTKSFVPVEMTKSFVPVERTEIVALVERTAVVVPLVEGIDAALEMARMRRCRGRGR